ncbi:hypothetical protein OSTOST_12322, partial [Ostertagia ostertagi]
TFTNTTQREQEYSFKTERCTRQLYSTVIIEKDIACEWTVALKLKTPCEVVEANAGFHQEVQLNHIGSNTSAQRTVGWAPVIVKYETKGTCIFRYGVEQKVKINETAVRSYYK